MPEGEIKALWAFTARPEPGGPEIVISVPDGSGGTQPLIGHDPEVIEALIGFAQAMATENGVEVRVVEFARTTNVRVLEPGEGGLVIMEGDAAVLGPPEPEVPSAE